jgi:hypothetical protein
MRLGLRVLELVMSTNNESSVFVRFRLFYLTEITFTQCRLDLYQQFPNVPQVFKIYILGLTSTGSQIICLERKQKSERNAFVRSDSFICYKSF